MKTNHTAAVQTASEGPLHALALQIKGIVLLPSQAVLHPRADLLKCAGGNLGCCATCSRSLAPAAPQHQRWIATPSGPTCDYYADVERVGWLYSPMTDHLLSVLAENSAATELV